MYKLNKMNNVVKILEQLLKKDVIDTNDDFFKIGGNSIKSLILINELEKLFNIKILISEIYEQKTIRDIISLVERKMNKSEDNIENIKSIHFNKFEKSRKNIFLIPPFVGSSIVYNDIIATIYETFNVIGLEYPGFHIIDEIADSIEMIAFQQIQEIKNIQNDGEYYIVGYSMGGLIAFEIAKEIEKDNRCSVNLFLIDCISDMKNKYFEGDSDSDDNMIKEMLDVYKEFLSLDKMSHYQFFLQNNVNIFRKYKFSGYVKGNICVFEAKENDLDMSQWVQYGQGKFRHKIVNGNHYSVINNLDLLKAIDM
jgi:surfactin synthase thioesterase subunit/acyl carrier protein